MQRSKNDWTLATITRNFTTRWKRRWRRMAQSAQLLDTSGLHRTESFQINLFHVIFLTTSSNHINSSKPSGYWTYYQVQKPHVLRSVHTMYLSVLCESQNNGTALTYRFLYKRWSVYNISTNKCTIAFCCSFITGYFWYTSQQLETLYFKIIFTNNFNCLIYTLIMWLFSKVTCF
jgi:hypothetical protein